MWWKPWWMGLNLWCRFHEICQFDDTKRSCRKRLAGHNQRRRKNQPDPQTTEDRRKPPISKMNASSLKATEHSDYSEISFRGNSNIRHFRIRWLSQSVLSLLWLLVTGNKPFPSKDTFPILYDVLIILGLDYHLLVICFCRIKFNSGIIPESFLFNLELCGLFVCGSRAHYVLYKLPIFSSDSWLKGFYVWVRNVSRSGGYCWCFDFGTVTFHRQPTGLKMVGMGDHTWFS